MSFFHDLKIAMRSLARVPALWLTVALTLALGIGANAAIFSVVRAVLLRPLTNRDEDQLLYIRQSAPGLQETNATFSIPEIKDIGEGLKSIRELGTFSEIDFTVVGLGTPREIPAGVVDGNYFDVMGLKPVLGRLLTPADDGQNAAGAVVLTYGFWRNSLHSDPNVLGKAVRLESFGGARTAVVVGVLEPAVPYPVATEIIANVVTSPHHLSATMVTGREHRMTEVFGRLAPGATVEAARAELKSVYAAMTLAHPEVYKAASHYAIDVTRMHDQINSKANTILWVLFAASGLLFVIASSNVANLVLARTVRRESELAVRSALGASTKTLRRSLLAESLILCVSGAVAAVILAVPMVGILGSCGAHGRGAGALRGALLRARQRHAARLQPGVVWDCAGSGGGGVPGVHSAAALGECAARHADRARRAGDGRQQTQASHLRGYADRGVVPAACGVGSVDEDSVRAGGEPAAVRFGEGAGGESAGDVVWAYAGAGARFLSRRAAADQHAARSGACIVRVQRAVAR